ncbi:hypothetical protein Q4E93_24885 [Flavitalea sp. BT771]|uniref:hypothetical protein n=1 Tax=Flavitalea sp. BT771 TaxID=3063329 RepID=UPI0026E2DD71|nr:hypothetical protein [Flavitalea sp. BT771]MDO6433866.1 hypothetical protein [Flavitalea sp. BT771]MDV6222229.1 hypothetical protein [Flavitalea sp. BT771]
MKRLIVYIACPFALLLLSRTLSAQPAPLVKVKVSVDSQKIVIGQPLQLMVEAFVQGNAPLTWPAIDSLPHFEWLEKGQLDSVVKPDERYYRQRFVITSFDSGAWAIPRLPFTSGHKKYFSDSIRIAVNYSRFDPSKDFHDIKDIIDIPNPYAKWIPWGVAAVTLIALALVVWLVLKKKLIQRAAAAASAPRLSPYEDAIRQLEELHKQGAGGDGQIKIYYTRLNDILRLFILRKLGIASLAETNEELIGQIRRLPLTRKQFDELAETLRMADFVKFAKYQPATADNEHNYQVIRQSVEHLNAIGQEEEKDEIEKKQNKPTT